MAYEFDEVKISQEIFYYLLEHHELKEEEVPQLYKAYTESESVQNLVKSQGEIADCSVERYGDVIYLIPDTESLPWLFQSTAEKGIVPEQCHGQGLLSGAVFHPYPAS